MSRSKVKKKMDLVKVFLAVLVVVLGGISGLFYYQMSQWKLAFESLQKSYSDLRGEYTDLEEMYSTLRGEYTDLQEMYSGCRSDYTDLQNRYSTLDREKMSLQNERDEILHFEKREVLDEDKTLDLVAGGNTRLSYDTSFAGYFEINFTASVDIYFWVGSSLTEDTYYARYPPFPETATNGTAVIPVCGTVYLYIHNPNELMTATITLTVTYIY